MNINIFFEFLRFSLDKEKTWNKKISENEWNEIYQMSYRQALVGVVYGGVKKLSKEFAPPFALALQWAAQAEKIRGMNIIFNSEAKRLTEIFSMENRKNVILKGQANARFYPDKFSRQPGDIDIYIEGGKESVVELIGKLGMLPKDLPESALKAYHHVHLPENENGISVEVHFRPSSGFFNSFYNNRLQEVLEENLKDLELTSDGFYSPSMRFAFLMQLAHLQRHFFMEGVGLRQITDYYFLLKNSTKEDREYVKGLLKRLNMHRFAEALMWILKQIFSLDEEFMICPSDENLGKKVMNDIIQGGNFGWYNRKKDEPWGKFFYNRKRNFKLLGINPWEILPNEMKYWKAFLKNMPKRIRYRTLSLETIKKDEEN